MKSRMLPVAVVTLLAVAASPAVSTADFKGFVKKVKEDLKKNNQQQPQQQPQPQGAPSQPQKHSGVSSPSGSGSRGGVNQTAASSSPGPAPAAVPAPSRSKIKVTEEELGDATMGMTISPDGRSLASAVRQGSRIALAVDGKAGPVMDKVAPREVAFSPDGNHYAYVGVKGGKQYLLVDHEAVAELPENPSSYSYSPRSLQFAESGGAFVYLIPQFGVIAGGKLYEGPIDRAVISKDGRHFAFVVRDGPQNQSRSVFLDGKKIGPSDGRALQFTAGGKLVYSAPDNELVVGNKPGPKSSQPIGSVELSPTGDHTAYETRAPRDPGSGKAAFQYVVDFKPAPPAKTIKRLVFNHDGTKWAYIANDGGGDFLVLNGKTVSMEYQSLHDGPAFSPGASHVFATALHNGQEFLLVDGKEQGPYQYVNLHQLVFSPDGKHYAFIENSQRQKRLIVDGKASPPMDAIDHLAYLPDGRLVYVFLKEANRDVMKRGLDQHTLVVGDKAVAVNIATPPIFSEDGRHLAYLDMSRPGDWESLHYVVDGKQYPPCGRPTAAAFSPDGQHFVYIAGPKLYVDGQLAEFSFDPGTALVVRGSPTANTGPSTLTFPDGNKVQLFAIRGGSVYRMTASLN